MRPSPPVQDEEVAELRKEQLKFLLETYKYCVGIFVTCTGFYLTIVAAALAFLLKGELPRDNARLAALTVLFFTFAWYWAAVGSLEFNRKLKAEACELWGRFGLRSDWIIAEYTAMAHKLGMLAMSAVVLVFSYLALWPTGK